MRILTLFVLAVTLLGALAGCKKEEPEPLDLGKDQSDLAEKIATGEKIKPEDVAPKEK
jgi:predicted component of type VI protein secretion system